MKKTIKIIDLLVKIANGEEVPKKIKFCRRLFVWVDNDYICCEINNELGDCNGLSIHKWIYSSLLNDEVEIIEEDKKIEKLIYSDYTSYADDVKEAFEKINEIIDTINELKGKSE